MNKITFWSSIAAVSIAASLVAVGQAHAADGVPAITAGTSGLPRMDVWIIGWAIRCIRTYGTRR